VTTGTSQGVYAYVESSAPFKFGDNAILTSPFIESSSQPGCFGVWYFMHGIDVYQLNVYKNDSNGLNVLSQLENEKGPIWFQLLINITSSVDYRIAIEGIVCFDFIC
jgi:hypothetical protein